ncbi:MAG: DUF7417 domain-containing protein [Burkholderiaceae bacterium]
MVDTLQAVMICEGVAEAQDEEEYIQAWQTLLDHGIVWQLQGWYQRYAIDLLNRGVLVHPADK